MNCPNCGNDDNNVVRTINYSNSIVVRYRRCKICKEYFKTSEIISFDSVRKEKVNDITTEP